MKCRRTARDGRARNWAARGTAERDAGLLRTGRLARWPETMGTWGHARRPSELAPIGSGLLPWPLVTHTPPNPHITLRRAPPYVDIYEKGV